MQNPTIFAVDLGNDGAKSYCPNTGKFVRVDSKSLMFRRDARNVPKPDSQSVIITPTISSSELVNCTTLVGNSAPAKGSTLLENKAVIGPWLAFASIACHWEDAPEEIIHIPNLYVSLPEPEKAVPGKFDEKGNPLSGEQYLKKVLSDSDRSQLHEFVAQKNKLSIHCRVQIDTITVRKEGEAQYNDCERGGVFERGKGWVAIPDFGGGTFIINIFDPEGNLHPTRPVHPKMGLIHLAQMIADDGELRKGVAGTPDPYKVLTSIRLAFTDESRDGKMLYANTGQAFNHLYDYYAPIYFSWAAGEVTNTLEYLNIIEDIECWAIAGGGALQVKRFWIPEEDRNDGLVRLAKDPVFGGCRGLIPQVAAFQQPDILPIDKKRVRAAG